MNYLYEARLLFNNWRYLSGVQIKYLISYLVSSLDTIAWFTGKKTTLDRAYLILTSGRLLKNEKDEKEFFNLYFSLKNLLNYNIKRIDEEKFKAWNYKYSLILDKQFFIEKFKEVEKYLSMFRNQ